MSPAVPSYPPQRSTTPSPSCSTSAEVPPSTAQGVERDLLFASHRPARSGIESTDQLLMAVPRAAPTQGPLISRSGTTAPTSCQRSARPAHQSYINADRSKVSPGGASWGVRPAIPGA